jgi:hypothetical protein
MPLAKTFALLQASNAMMTPARTLKNGEFEVETDSSKQLAWEYHRLATEIMERAIEELDAVTSARLMRLAEEYEELGQFEEARAA